MKGAFERLGRRFLFSLDPEIAHGLSIRALGAGVSLCRRVSETPVLATTVAGIRFPNPLGLAAGYDKDAEVPDASLGLGFGFAECGTVTPLPQPGNPKPRIFRLEADGAVINRLGFNNGGHAAFLDRLKARAGKPGVVGVNIGANRDNTDRIADYEAGARIFAALASYLTVNISSPNTKGLRDLQGGEQLSELLARVTAAREAGDGAPTPIFLKIAPDLEEEALAAIANAVAEHRVDGLVVANTTLSRAGLASPRAGESGGLSGRPLFTRSTVVLARMRKLVGPDLPIIGTGGVDSAETALEKMRAGADLVQLYTGMIFAGPALPGRIVSGMADFCLDAGLASVADIRDTRVDDWANHPLN